MQTSVEIRVRGFLMVVLGGCLVAFMGYISLWMLTPAGDGGPGHSRFTGTHEQMLMIAGLFGLIIVLGLISFITGLWQLILGRRNRLFVRAIVGLGILFFIGCGLVYWFF